MNIAFFTLGCKVNQYETQCLREGFSVCGHTIVADSAPFDAIIIKSCTVTAESDRKNRQIIRRFRRENPEAAIVLTGCMAEAFPEESEKLLDADVVVGNTDVLRVIELTEQFFKTRERIVEISAHKTGEKFNTPSIHSFAERTRAFMKIEDGCDRFCSYCIIPTARGRVRSKPCDLIKQEAEQLAANGFSEVVLVGINLSAYGKGEDINLCDAIDAVCEVEGIKRVRLGSLEPDHISNEMLSRFKKQEKFCEQFHLSLQSGCDATLKRMNRHYDSAFYYDLITRIRNMFPNASITTDVMVGFAGETEEEFNRSLEFVKKAGFAKAHVFAYSRRKGTVAYGLPAQVTNAEKSRRSKLMISAADQSEAKFLQNQVGKTFPVLFETFDGEYVEGYTPNYSRVMVKCDNAPIGEIREVTIVSAHQTYCIGEIV